MAGNGEQGHSKKSQQQSASAHKPARVPQRLEIRGTLAVLIHTVFGKRPVRTEILDEVRTSRGAWMHRVCWVRPAEIFTPDGAVIIRITRTAASADGAAGPAAPAPAATTVRPDGRSAPRSPGTPLRPEPTGPSPTSPPNTRPPSRPGRRPPAPGRPPRSPHGTPALGDEGQEDR
jgi:hypothetical protein